MLYVAGDLCGGRVPEVDGLHHHHVELGLQLHNLSCNISLITASWKSNILLKSKNSVCFPESYIYIIEV